MGDRMKIIFLLGIIYISSINAGKAWQIEIQNPATPVIKGIVLFDFYANLFILTILTFIFFWLFYESFKDGFKFFKFFKNLNIQGMSNSTLLEFIWTILLSFILLIVAISSITLLHSIEESVQPQLHSLNIVKSDHTQHLQLLNEEDSIQQYLKPLSMIRSLDSPVNSKVVPTTISWEQLQYETFEKVEFSLPTFKKIGIDQIQAREVFWGQSIVTARVVGINAAGTKSIEIIRVTCFVGAEYTKGTVLPKNMPEGFMIHTWDKGSHHAHLEGSSGNYRAVIACEFDF